MHAPVAGAEDSNRVLSIIESRGRTVRRRHGRKVIALPRVRAHLLMPVPYLSYFTSSVEAPLGSVLGRIQESVVPQLGQGPIVFRRTTEDSPSQMGEVTAVAGPKDHERTDEGA